MANSAYSTRSLAATEKPRDDHAVLLENRRVKFGLKIPNRLGKCQQTFRGDFFDPHCRFFWHRRIYAAPAVWNSPHLAFATLPIPFVAFLKLIASSRLSAPHSGSPKYLRFGLWLTQCTLNIDLLIYLLTNYDRTRRTVSCSVNSDGDTRVISLPFS